MVRGKVLKSGKLAFYNGRYKADAKEVKNFIKKNYEIIDPTKLQADQKRYLGAVKGGKARAAQSLTTKNGRFLPQSLQKKALQNLGIDIEAMRKGKNLKTIREIFKDSPDLQKSFDKLISETGLELWYDSEKAVDKIQSYTGESIYINGVKVDRKEAVKRISSYAKKMKRKFDLYHPGVSFKLFYKNEELFINLDNEVYSTGEDSDNVQLYHANK